MKKCNCFFLNQFFSIPPISIVYTRGFFQVQQAAEEAAPLKFPLDPTSWKSKSTPLISAIWRFGNLQLQKKNATQKNIRWYFWFYLKGCWESGVWIWFEGSSGPFSLTSHPGGVWYTHSSWTGSNLFFPTFPWHPTGIIKLSNFGKFWGISP